MPGALVILFTSLLVGYSGALVPGPLLAIDILESTRRGFWVGPSLVLGHGIVELVLVLALALGLSQFLQARLLTTTIAILGALFLFWMAFSLLKEVRRGATMEPEVKARATGAPILAGVLASLSNPYWVLWWTTVGASYVLWSLREGPWGLAYFYGGHILADASWYSFVSLVVGSGRKLVSNTVYRSILLFCSGFLVLLAGYFMASAVKFLMGIDFL